MHTPHADRLHGFDGLRAVAISLVVLWHTYIALGFPREALGSIERLVSASWTGVDIFFAISGYLITTLILREEQTSAARGNGVRFHLKSFYARRALRILPLFYVVFLLNTFVLPFAGIFQSTLAFDIFERGTPASFLPYALFLGNYYGIHGAAFVGNLHLDPGNAYSVTWSLCVEEHFYLLWPVFLFFVKGRMRRITVALATCLGIACLRYVSLRWHWERYPSQHVLSHYRLDSILWGCLGALLVQAQVLTAQVRRLLLVALSLGAIYCLATNALSVMPHGTAAGESAGLSLLAAAATMWLIELSATPGAPLTRLLELSPLRFLGRLAFAIYLLHFQAIDVARLFLNETPMAPTPINLLLAAAFVMCIAIAFASVLHIAVERPFLRLKARYSRLPKPTDGSETKEAPVGASAPLA